MANQVSVVLTGRDELSGVLRRAQSGLTAFKAAITAFVSIEIAQYLKDLTTRFIDLARSVDGPVKEAFENLEQSQGKFAAGVLEAGGVVSAFNELSESIDSGQFDELAINLAMFTKIFLELAQVVLGNIPAITAALTALAAAVGLVVAPVPTLIALVTGGAAVTGFTLGYRQDKEQLEVIREQYRQRILISRLRQQERDLLAEIEQQTQQLLNNERTVVSLAEYKDKLTQREIFNLQTLYENRLQDIRSQAIGVNDIERRLQLLQREAALERALAALREPAQIEGIIAQTRSLSSTTGELVEISKTYNMMTREQQSIHLAALEIQKQLIEAKLLDADASALQIARYREMASSIQQAIAATTGEVQEVVQTEMESLAEGIAQTIENTFTEAISNAFFNAFSGDGLQGFAAGLGNVVLSALGTIFSEMGKALIAFGGVMEKLKLALLNVFTSGPAAIAAGVALVALGGALSGIATANASATSFISPSSSVLGGGTLGQNALTTTQGESTIVINGGLLDMSDPRQASALSNALSELSGRRVTVTGA